MNQTIVKNFNGYVGERGLHSLIWKNGGMYSTIFTSKGNPCVTIHSYSGISKMEFDYICKMGESYFWNWWKKMRKTTRILQIKNIGSGSSYEPISEIVKNRI